MENQTKKLNYKVNKKKAFLDDNEDGILLESAKIASSKAVRSSMALGITIKVIRGNEIISINPDKTEKVLRQISKSTIDTSSLKKGMILEKK